MNDECKLEVVSILRTVRDAHAGEIGTHHATCHKNHAACLAVLILDTIAYHEEEDTNG